VIQHIDKPANKDYMHLCTELTEEYLLSILKSQLDINFKPSPEIVVAISGGLDSTVLLNVCAKLAKKGLISSLNAMHINHAISSDSLNWQHFCESLCNSLNVPLKCYKANIPDNPRKGLEAAARDARYKIFAAGMPSKGYLLQAHHLNDQAETVLYRIMRGSGMKGLSAIPPKRKFGAGTIIRPLLQVPHHLIKSYAANNRLEWINDNSNRDQSFDRNFLRHTVIPNLTSRWHDANKKLAQIASSSYNDLELLNEILQSDLNDTIYTDEIPFISKAYALKIEPLMKLSSCRQRHLLRYWLEQKNFPIPSRLTLERIFSELIPASSQSQPTVRWPSCEIRRYKNLIIALMPVIQPELRSLSVLLNEKSIILPGNGKLHISEYTKKTESLSSTVLWPDQKPIKINYRRNLNIEPFRIPKHKGSKSLKKWLNSLHTPYWIRDQLPILHDNNKFIAIPGLLINEDYTLEQYFNTIHTHDSSTLSSMTNNIFSLKRWIFKWIPNSEN